MKITEILDSSYSWAAIYGINLDVCKTLVNEYKSLIAQAKLAKQIRNLVDDQYWREKVYRRVLDGSIRFSDAVESYVLAVNKTNLRKMDTNLDKICKSLVKMKDNITNFVENGIV
jgi:hypothetical protein